MPSRLRSKEGLASAFRVYGTTSRTRLVRFQCKQPLAFAVWVDRSATRAFRNVCDKFLLTDTSRIHWPPSFARLGSCSTADSFLFL